MRERKRLEDALNSEADLARRATEIDTYFELAREGEDVGPEIKKEIDGLRSLVDRLETETLLSGDNDARNAIVTIHPGAGGTESQDWADMLLRMYLRWAERNGYAATLNDYQPGEEAGAKSITVQRQRRIYVWPVDQRNRRPPAGADFTLRPGAPAAHLVRQCLRLSGNR